MATEFSIETSFTREPEPLSAEVSSWSQPGALKTSSGATVTVPSAA